MMWNDFVIIIWYDNNDMISHMLWYVMICYDMIIIW